MRRRALSLILLPFLALGCSGSSSQPGDASAGSTTASSSAPRTTASSQPTEPPVTTAGTAPGTTTTAAPTTTTTAPVVGWPAPGHDLDNSRAASGSKITGANVATLQPAWEATITGGLTTVPIVVDGVVYVGDGSGRISAIDEATGTVRWASTPTGFSIGPFGVAVADGKVFGLLGSSGVVAVDATNGTQLWQTTITTTPSQGVDIQPQVADGIVLVSTVPVSIGGIYKGGDHGVIHALDAATGKERWSFDTVDSADLWGNPAVNSGGGAWYPPAVDAKRGLVYFGVANPAPFPGTKEFPNGSSRPGPNLYTDSVVALDLRTGALRWYHQVHPHDLFDRDLVHTMIVHSPERDLVIGTGKGGVIVALDPDSGALVWQTPVGHHEHDDLTSLDAATLVAPGTYGGVITPPAAADGVIYAATVDEPVTLKPDETAYFGAPMGERNGQLTAIDAADGSVRWTAELPGDPLGAATVVNDLVLAPTLQGTLVALDRATGNEVWRTKLAGGVNGWMAVTTDALIIPEGAASPPRVVAYRLA